MWLKILLGSPFLLSLLSAFVLASLAFTTNPAPTEAKRSKHGVPRACGC